MKKLWSFIFLVLCVSLPFLSYKDTLLFKDNYFDVECYYNYKNTSFPECETLKNGEGSIVKTNSIFYYDNKNKFDYSLSGITFITNIKDININEIKERLNIKTLSISTDKNIYGYTNCFNNSINLQNKKVNIQILLKDNKIFIGSPILLGSY